MISTSIPPESPSLSTSTLSNNLESFGLKQGCLLKHRASSKFLFPPANFFHLPWKSCFVRINGIGEMLLFKSRLYILGNGKGGVGDTFDTLILRHALAEKVTICRKQSIANQFKLTLYNGSIFYFKLVSISGDMKLTIEEEVTSWINSINYVAASKTVIPLPMAICSKIKECIPPGLPLGLSTLDKVSSCPMRYLILFSENDLSP